MHIERRKCEILIVVGTSGQPRPAADGQRRKLRLRSVGRRELKG